MGVGEWIAIIIIIIITVIPIYLYTAPDNGTYMPCSTSPRPTTSLTVVFGLMRSIGACIRRFHGVCPRFPFWKVCYKSLPNQHNKQQRNHVGAPTFNGTPGWELCHPYKSHPSSPNILYRVISIISIPNLRPYGYHSLYKPPFMARLGEVLEIAQFSNTYQDGLLDLNNFLI